MNFSAVCFVSHDGIPHSPAADPADITYMFPWRAAEGYFFACVRVRTCWCVCVCRCVRACCFFFFALNMSFSMVIASSCLLLLRSVHSKGQNAHRTRESQHKIPAVLRRELDVELRTPAAGIGGAPNLSRHGAPSKPEKANPVCPPGPPVLLPDSLPPSAPASGWWGLVFQQAIKEFPKSNPQTKAALRQWPKLKQTFQRIT